MRTIIKVSLVGFTCAVLSTPSPAAFTGLELRRVDGTDWTDVTFQLWATFDETPGCTFDGYVTAVAGVPGMPMDIRVTDGTFYQHVFGADIAPSHEGAKSFPSLAVDTFVTMYTLTSAPCMDLSPGWPGFGVDSLGGESLSWFAIPDVPACPGCLIDDAHPLAQFSLIDGAEPGEARVSGWMLVQWTDEFGAGQEAYMYVAYCEADLTRDNTVDVNDLLALLSNYGGSDPAADIVPAGGDGSVDILDLLEVLSNWGSCE